MHQDAHGLDVTVVSDAAARAYDHIIEGFTGYRADLQQRMEALFALDPDCGLGHCLRGYFTLMSFKQAALPAARAASEAARRCSVRGTERERAHAAALEAWVGGEPDRAVRAWDQILAAHPRDLLAFRLAHFVNFWLGRPDAMLASVLAVQPHWSDADPGYAALLACRCFAHEECGYYTEAEAAGREAIRLDPGDPWAAHGVAHVLEMQGRRGEGIAWIEGLQPNWADRNNLRHHLSWHAAMYHLERGDMARVLALYDTGFRDLASPLTQAMPDLYIDVQNAASMLFRLGRHGVDVGNRWEELADKAEGRIGDCLSGFTLPHWMMALAATGREAAAHRMLEAMRAFARRPANGGPDDVRADNARPDDARPDHASLDNARPDNTGSDNGRPDMAGRDARDYAGAGHPAAEYPILENSIPENSIPENSIPENSTADLPRAWAERLAAEVALPIAEAVLAHGQGRHAAAVGLMRPVLGEMYRLGGSHAQQDVLEQLYLDAALRAGLTEDARSLLERVAGRHPLPPSRRRGYAMAAALLA